MNKLDSLRSEHGQIMLQLARALGSSLNWASHCEIAEIMHTVHFDYTSRQKEQDYLQLDRPAPSSASIAPEPTPECISVGNPGWWNRCGLIGCPACI